MGRYETATLRLAAAAVVSGRAKTPRLPAVTSPTRTAAALTTALLALSGCGGEPPEGPRPGAQHTDLDGNVYNDHDVTFTRNMVQHHAQALAMVALTQTRSVPPQVRRLATGIVDRQSPETQEMTTWLVGWDQPTPPTMMDHAHAPHGHGGGDGESGGTYEMPKMPDMPGLLTAEEFGALEAASGAEFASLWAEAMLEHHEGAVEMARDEIEVGAYEPTVKLASDIVDDQGQEISELERLLAE